MIRDYDSRLNTGNTTALELQTSLDTGASQNIIQSSLEASLNLKGKDRTNKEVRFDTQRGRASLLN